MAGPKQMKIILVSQLQHKKSLVDSFVLSASLEGKVSLRYVNLNLMYFSKTLVKLK